VPETLKDVPLNCSQKIIITVCAIVRSSLGSVNM